MRDDRVMDEKTVWGANQFIGVSKSKFKQTMWLRKRRFWLFDVFCPSEPLRANWSKPENVQMLEKTKLNSKPTHRRFSLNAKTKQTEFLYTFDLQTDFFFQADFCNKFLSSASIPHSKQFNYILRSKTHRIDCVETKNKAYFLCVFACEWNLSIESILMRKCGDIAHFNVVFQSSDFQFYLFRLIWHNDVEFGSLSRCMFDFRRKKWDFSTWFRIIDYDFWNMKFIEAFHGSVADSMWKVKIGWNINKMYK